MGTQDVAYGKTQKIDYEGIDLLNAGYVPAINAANATIATLQAKINQGAGRTVYIGDESKTYEVSGTLTLPTGITLEGGAKLVQKLPNTKLLDVSNTSGVRIEGVQLQGYGAGDFNNSPSSNAVGIVATNATDLIVESVRLKLFSCAGVFLHACNGVLVVDSTIEGVDFVVVNPDDYGASYGIAADGFCTKLDIRGNRISKGGQGIATGDNGMDGVSIVDNRISDIKGQHGIYAGAGIDDLLISRNTIKDTRLIGIKVQNQAAVAKDMRGVVIVGNVLKGNVGGGIQVYHTTANSVYKFKGLVVANNSIRQAGQDGLYLGTIEAGVISNNDIYDSTREGIAIAGYVDSSDIVSNVIHRTGYNGIFAYLLNTDSRISRNHIFEPCLLGVAAQKNGIKINGATGLEMSLNRIKATHANMQYGIFVEDGDQATYRVWGNVTRGAAEHGARFKNPQATVAYYADNDFQGTLGDVLLPPIYSKVGVEAEVGAAAPATVPARVGLLFVDTVNAKVYVSKGNAAVADWVAVN